MEEDIFCLEDVEFKIKKLANGTTRDIEGYQAEIFKMARLVLIPHVYKLHSLAVKQDFLKPWTQSLIVPIFKSGDKNIPSNYKTIMISHILAKLYGLILEKKKFSVWLENQ